MTEQINIRVDKSIVQEFEDLARHENLDRAALVKKIMLDGLQQERPNFVIQEHVLSGK